MSNDSVRSDLDADHALPTDRAVTTPSFDTLFDILADSRRRYALYALVGSDEGVEDVETLVDDVSMLEARAESATLTDARRSEIAADLREVHLPCLEAADIVEYDARTDAIRYWPQPTLEEYLEHTHFKEFPGE